MRLENHVDDKLALIDHGSTINAILEEFYEMEKWPIITDHEGRVLNGGQPTSKLPSVMLVQM